MQLKRISLCLTRQRPDDVQKYQHFVVKATVSLYCVLRKHQAVVKTMGNLNLILKFCYFQIQILQWMSHRSRRQLLLLGDYFVMEIKISITFSLHLNCSVLLGCIQTLNESCSCFCIKEPHYKEGWLHARVLCIPAIQRLNSKS